MEQLLKDIKRLTDIIVGSKSDTTIAGEIESMALEIGHHPLVLNAHNPNAFANVSGQWVEMTIDNLPNIGDLIVLEIPPEQMTKNNPRITKYTNQTEWIDGSRYIILKPIDA